MSTEQLSPANEAAVEASIAKFHAIVEERDQLKVGLANANEEIRNQRGINAVQKVSMDEMRDAHARELASARVETERAKTEQQAELARRVTAETLLRNMASILHDYRFSSEPIQQPRPGVEQIGLHAVENVLQIESNGRGR